MEKLRWWIARLLDRLPGQCWANLCTWALWREPGDPRLPWSPNRDCLPDAERVGACYCGKLRPGGESR